MHRAYASFDKIKESLMQQRELADLRFLVSEETAARKKSEVKSTNLKVGIRPTLPRA